MNEKTLESFINTCDEMMVPVEEGLLDFMKNRKNKKIGRRVREVLNIYSNNVLLNILFSKHMNIANYFSGRLNRVIKPSYQIAISASYVEYLTECKLFIEQRVAELYTVICDFMKKSNVEEYKTLLNKCVNVKEMIDILDKKYKDIFTKIGNMQKIDKTKLTEAPIKSDNEIILSHTEFKDLLTFKESTQKELYYITNLSGFESNLDIKTMVGNSYYALSKKLSEEEISNIANIILDSIKIPDTGSLYNIIPEIIVTIIKETGTLMKNVSGKMFIIQDGNRIPV